ncbi:MAG: hypothetical protein L6R40_004164 [Gallowayella cf. fulva]|nr:MAG: hypothetical protein L6R40_004164 [Xanthomendoza cf. fulva]
MSKDHLNPTSPSTSSPHPPIQHPQTTSPHPLRNPPHQKALPPPRVSTTLFARACRPPPQTPPRPLIRSKPV